MTKGKEVKEAPKVEEKKVQEQPAKVTFEEFVRQTSKTELVSFYRRYEQHIKVSQEKQGKIKTPEQFYNESK
jgi:hypothetical protein